MAVETKFRRGTTLDHSTFTGAAGEITVDTTLNVPVVHDGATVGGFPVVGEKAIIEVVAGEALGSNRVVQSDGTVAMYSDSATIANMPLVLGITTNAVNIGELSFIRTAGELYDATWTWVEGAVYNGLNGVLTQTPPTTGFVLQVATAISATKILIGIKQGIIRG